MPNRILHESIKYCPKMEHLNWFEEVVYHRLTVTVDDYGCLDGRIVLLKNTLFQICIRDRKMCARAWPGCCPPPRCFPWRFATTPIAP